MDVFADESKIVAEIAFVDGNNQGIVPTALDYRVVDQNDADIVASTSIAVPANGAESVNITVDAVDNTLGAGVMQALRVIELTATTSDGAKHISKYAYKIQTASLLVVPDNSYQSYNMALFLADDIGSLNVWHSAGERERVKAMIEAHDRLGALRYSVYFEESQSRITTVPWDSFEEIRHINDLTKTELETLQAKFLTSLRKAQIVEADNVLGGDPIEDQRRIGLMSTTVGESSQMYRSVPPLKLPVSERALRHLTGYVRWGMKMGRG